MSSSELNNDGMGVLSEAASLAHPSVPEEGTQEGVDIAAEAFAASIAEDHEYLVETVNSEESNEETESDVEEEDHDQDNYKQDDEDDDDEQEDDDNNDDNEQQHDEDDDDKQEDDQNDHSEQDDEDDDDDDNYNNNNNSSDCNNPIVTGERFLELVGSNKAFGSLVAKDELGDYMILFDDARIISVSANQLKEGVAEYMDFVKHGRVRDTFIKHTGPMIDAFYDNQDDFFRIWSRSNMFYERPPMGNVGMSPEDFIGMKFVNPDEEGDVYSISSHMLSGRKLKYPMNNVDFVAHNRNNEKIVISYGEFLLQRREFVVKFGAPLIPREDALKRRLGKVDLDAQVESNIAAATEAHPQSDALRRSVRKRKPTAAAKEQLEQQKPPKTNAKPSGQDSDDDEDVDDVDDEMVQKSVLALQDAKRKALVSWEKKVKARENKLKKDESTLRQKQEDLQKERDEFERERKEFEKEKEKFQRKQTSAQRKQTSANTTANEGTTAKERLYEMHGVRRNDVWKVIKLVHPDTPLPQGQTQWENKDAIGAYCKLCETEIAGFKSTAQSNSVTAHYKKFHAPSTTHSTTSNVIAPTTPAGGGGAAATAANLHLLSSATPAPAGVPTAQLSVHPSTTVTPAPAAQLSVHPSTTVTPGYYHQPPVQQHPMQQQPPMMQMQQQPPTMQQQPPMMQMQMQQQPYYQPPPHGYYAPAPQPPYYNGYPPPPHHYRPY